MDKYVIRINGTAYDVEVEKVSADGGAAVYAAAPDTGTAKSAATPQAAPAAQPAAAPDRNSSASEPEGEKVTAGTAGTVWKVVASEGDIVKRGDTIIVLESMKMEIDVVAPKDGKVGCILVGQDDPIETGQTVATII